MLIDVPDVVIDRFAQFTPDELGVLRGNIKSPLFQKMLSVVECGKPSPFGVLDGSLATAKLGEQRGWMLYQAAMFAVLNPKVARVQTEESYQPPITDLPVPEEPDKPETT